MTSKLARIVLLSLAPLLAGGAQVGAQTPAPRDIPKGFVVPGPKPTNAPKDAPGGAGASGTVSVAPQSAAPASAAPQAEAPQTEAPQAGAATAAGDQPAQTPAPGINGSMATSPLYLAPDAGTTQLLGGGTAGTAGGAHEWPCFQRKIDQVDAGQVWQGPPLDAAASVPRTPAMLQLVETLKTRRVALAEAEKTAAGFLGELPRAERAGVAAAVFADLLDSLNKERSGIMRGIERYGAKQQQLAEKIRKENAAISAMRQTAKADPAKLQEAQEAILWDTRIFNERRGSLSYVCEVPTLIEQRLFALGRAIGKTL